MDQSQCSPRDGRSAIRGGMASCAPKGRLDRNWGVPVGCAGEGTVSTGGDKAQTVPGRAEEDSVGNEAQGPFKENSE